MVQGLDPPNLRPVVGKQLLQGNKNRKSLADTGLGRASLDVEDLRKMRYNLCRLGMCQYDTVLLWFSMLCMFYGSFRVHEVFPRKKSEYDPDSTLLRKDITLQTVYISGALVEVLMTNIKGPKEAQGNSVKVELFANGTKSCPVKADKKLLHFWGHGKNWQVQLMTKMNSTLMMGREIQN